MIDRLFTAALAFTLLAGGTAAVGSAMFGEQASREAVVAAAAAKRLPTVEITVKRVAQGERSTQVQ
jgi:predicted kinase